MKRNYELHELNEIEDSTELISMLEFCSQGCECIRIFVPIRDEIAKSNSSKICKIREIRS